MSDEEIYLDYDEPGFVEEEFDEFEREGFAEPAENEDLRLDEPAENFEDAKHVKETKPSTLFPEPAGNEYNNNRVGVGFAESTPTDEMQQKKKKQRGKPFKIFKAPRSRSRSNASEATVPEEEKLKLLPDCCEFTHYDNTAFEFDEGRKEMSSAWFRTVKLSPAQQKQLCFSESLLMVEETGVVVGKYYSTVSNSKWNDKPCLCVHAGSFGKFSTGLESGTSITSFIKYNFTPVQELVHEWSTLNSDTIERKTLITKESADNLICKITLLRNGQVVDSKSFHFGLKEREDLITEGMNLLLQRFLILEKRTVGSMTVKSVSYKGKVVPAKYEELGSGWENVKGKQMKTWGIRRTVNISEDEERIWDSLYNKNSRLILRCQPDSPQALIPLWFESVIDFDKYGHFIGTYSPHAWACDMELYSTYVVKKEEATHDHRRYIKDHPELAALLSDYMQSILFKKPQDVIDFTRQYFESFLNLRPKMRKSHAVRKLVLDTFSKVTTVHNSIASSMSSVNLGEGEWLGEGDDADPSSYYSVKPTVDFEGLEHVDTNDSEVPTTEYDNDTEDDLMVNEKGQYIKAKSHVKTVK